MKKVRDSFAKRMMYLAMSLLAMVVVFAFGTSPEAGILVTSSLALIPIFGSVDLGTFKELSSEEVKGLSEEDQLKYFDERSKFQDKKLENLKAELEKNANESIKDQIKTLKESINAENLEQMKVFKNALNIQGTAVKNLMTKGVSNGKVTLSKELESKRNEFKELMTATRKEIEIKALTVRASVSDNENAYLLPDIGQLATKKLTAYDVFPKIRISDKNTNGTIRYYDWDEETTVRAAAMVAEGAAFPSSTAKWKGYTLDIMKIGDSIPYTKEMEEDSQTFAAELSMFLETNVKILENDQVVNGDGTGNNLTGLIASIPAYTAVAEGMTDPTIYDLVVKLRETIESTQGGKYTTDVALMNLSDINKYKLKKDGNNNYILPPFYDQAGNRIDSVYIIEDNSVTANTMAIGDRKFARLYERTGYEASKGQVNNQFLEDEETLKIRKRLAFLIRNVDKTGFLKVTSISGALTTLGS